MRVSVSKILDFTDKLNEDPNSYCFNPSIAHWKDDLYLVCYRTFIRRIGYEKNPDQVHNDYRANHPWLVSEFWKVVDGYDKTGFCILKIDKHGINLHKALNDGESLFYFIEDRIVKSENRLMEGNDARIII